MPTSSNSGIILGDCWSFLCSFGCLVSRSAWIGVERWNSSGGKFNLSNGQCACGAARLCRNWCLERNASRVEVGAGRVWSLDSGHSLRPTDRPSHSLALAPPAGRRRCCCTDMQWEGLVTWADAGRCAGGRRLRLPLGSLPPMRVA